MIFIISIIFIIRIQAQPVSIYIISGSQNIDTNNISEEVEKYDNQIAEDPSSAIAYFNRGVAKYILRDFSGAISDFNKVIEINPQYAEAYYARGLFKNVLGDIEESKMDYDKAVELNPELRKKPYPN
jgi:tetratricopeptide (TPR) repeat protein